MKSKEEKEDDLRQREAQFRQARAIKYILQGLRYILGYLSDYHVEFRPEFAQNPIEVILRVYWSPQDQTWDTLPTVLRQKIEALEQELSRITHTERDSEISESIRKNGAD